MARFIDNKDGTVTDMSTNLMWQRCKGERFTFEDAQKYAASLTLAGYRDWRLPTIVELLSLVHHDKNDPAINSIFECNSSDYWSGIIVANTPYYARIAYIYYGNGNWSHKTTCGYARCVRNFKKEK